MPGACCLAAALLFAAKIVHSASLQSMDQAVFRIESLARISPPVPADFMGVSLLVDDIINSVGNCSLTGVKTSYLQLMQNFADLTAEASAHQGYERGETPTKCTAIFGLNFRDGTNASLAIDEALQLQILAQQYNGGALATGLLAGFEIGNEVDEDNDDGKRSGPWTPDMYWAQWGAYVKNITAALGLTSAPDTAIFQAAVFTMGIPAWDQSLIAVMLNGTYKDYIRTVSYHRYGTASRCNGINITMDDFLSDNITENSLGHGDLNEVVAAARQANVTVYMGETNSIACGGQYGLSDSFASSMWIVDWMVTLARMGWHGFNLHGGSGNAYTPVTFTSQGDLSAYVRPGYIGMLAGMEFLINATSLVNISAISTTVPAPGNDTSGFSGLGLKAHAGIDRDGVMRIFLLHRAFRQTSPANVTVQLAAGLVSAWPQSASLARLWAPNATDGVYSTSGVAWAGLSFDGTTDGKPVGTRTEEVVPILMDSSGSATVTCTLPPGSAAMLIIHTAQA